MSRPESRLSRLWSLVCWFVGVCVCAHAQEAPVDAWAKDTLGDYRFDNSDLDVMDKSPKADLAGGVSFTGDVLEVNGEYEHGPTTGYRSVVGMPSLNQDSFTVSLHFWPRDFKVAPNTDGLSWRFRERLFRYGLISKAPPSTGHETILMAGKSYRWLGYKVLDGNLCLTLNNGDVVHHFQGVSVSTRRWHSLVASVDRRARRVATSLDGVRLPDFTLPEGFQWNNITDGTAPEDRQFTLTDYSVGTCFNGYVARLRVLDRSLDAGELDRYASAMRQDLPAFRPSDKAMRWGLIAIAGGIAGAICLSLVLRLRSAARKRQRTAAGLP